MDREFAIFDLDGTLVDSMGFWRRTEEEFLRSRGISGDLGEILEQIKPMTVPEAARLFIRTYGLSGTPESMTEEMYAVMARHYRTDIPLKDGAAEYLSRLKERGVSMCVASATEADLMEECLRRLGVWDCFQFALSCMDVGAGKFQPDIYLESARRLGADPADIAVYEDAPYALRTAKNAGFYTVGVYDRSGAAHWEEIQKLADETIPDWRSA